MSNIAKLNVVSDVNKNKNHDNENDNGDDNGHVGDNVCLSALEVINAEDSHIGS